MTVYLLDPFLIDYSGHCYNYLECVRHALRRRNIEAQIIGNELCNIEIRQHGVKGVFSKSALKPVKHKIRYSITKYLKSIFNPQKHDDAEAFKENFKSFMEYTKSNEKDIIFINSLRPGQFLGLALWFQDQDLSKCPKIVLVLHFTSRLNNWSGYIYKKQYREAFDLCKEAHNLNRLIILADTEELISEYRKLGAPSIYLAPIPDFWEVKENPNFHFENKNLKQKQNNNDSTIIISFVGQARRDKGFYLLPTIIKNLTHYISSNKIKFLIQTGPLDKIDYRGRATIEELKDLNAQIIDEMLNAEDYYNFIESSDIILLPYAGFTYHSQSSGIFAEAMSRGKIVVAPIGTWMGNQLMGFDLNFKKNNILRSDVTEQIIAILQGIIEDYDITKNKFKIVSKQWRSKNNIEMLVDRIL